MKPTRVGVEINVHGANDLDVESGRRPSSGEASAVKDYMCCGREDDLDQGLDFEREEAAITGGIPTEWVSLTKLKTLNVAECGLDGTCVVRVYPAPQP